MRPSFLIAALASATCRMPDTFARLSLFHSLGGGRRGGEMAGKPVRARLSLHTAPCGGHATIEMRVLPEALDGICLWWSLPDQRMHFGKFRSKRWSSWRSFVDEADFGDGNLLLGRACGQEAGTEDPAAPRCEFGFACASARAFLLLALRWCSANKQTGRADYLANGMFIMLTHLFSSLSCSLRVAGAGPLTTTDTAIEGRRMVSFTVENGVADLQAPRNARPGDFSRNLPGIMDDIPECSLLDLLLAAPCLVKRLSTDFGYLAQMVWILAPLVEEAVLHTSPLQHGTADWIPCSPLECGLDQMARHQRAPLAYAYVEANAKKLTDSGVLCVAVDDGRVGRSPWKLGAVLDPSTNMAFWLVPQVDKRKFP